MRPSKLFKKDLNWLKIPQNNKLINHLPPQNLKRPQSDVTNYWNVNSSTPSHDFIPYIKGLKYNFLKNSDKQRHDFHKFIHGMQIKMKIICKILCWHFLYDWHLMACGKFHIDFLFNKTLLGSCSIWCKRGK